MASGSAAGSGSGSSGGAAAAASAAAANDDPTSHESVQVFGKRIATLSMAVDRVSRRLAACAAPDEPASTSSSSSSAAARAATAPLPRVPILRSLLLPSSGGSGISSSSSSSVSPADGLPPHAALHAFCADALDAVQAACASLASSSAAEAGPAAAAAARVDSLLSHVASPLLALLSLWRPLGAPGLCGGASAEQALLARLQAALGTASAALAARGGHAAADADALSLFCGSATSLSGRLAAAAVQSEYASEDSDALQTLAEWRLSSGPALPSPDAPTHPATLAAVADVLHASAAGAMHWATSELFGGGLRPAVSAALGASALVQAEAPPAPPTLLAAFGVPLMVPIPPPASSDAGDASRLFLRSLLAPEPGSPAAALSALMDKDVGNGGPKLRKAGGALDPLGRAATVAALWVCGIAPLAVAAAAALATGGSAPADAASVPLGPGASLTWAQVLPYLRMAWRVGLRAKVGAAEARQKDGLVCPVHVDSLAPPQQQPQAAAAPSPGGAAAGAAAAQPPDAAAAARVKLSDYAGIGGAHAAAALFVFEAVEPAVDGVAAALKFAAPSQARAARAPALARQASSQQPAAAAAADTAAAAGGDSAVSHGLAVHPATAAVAEDLFTWVRRAAARVHPAAVALCVWQATRKATARAAGLEQLAGLVKSAEAGAAADDFAQLAMLLPWSQVALRGCALAPQRRFISRFAPTERVEQAAKAAALGSALDAVWRAAGTDEEAPELPRASALLQGVAVPLAGRSACVARQMLALAPPPLRSAAIVSLTQAGGGLSGPGASAHAVDFGGICAAYGLPASLPVAQWSLGSRAALLSVATALRYTYMMRDGSGGGSSSSSAYSPHDATCAAVCPAATSRAFDTRPHKSPDYLVASSLTRAMSAFGSSVARTAAATAAPSTAASTPAGAGGRPAPSKAAPRPSHRYGRSNSEGSDDDDMPPIDGDSSDAAPAPRAPVSLEEHAPPIRRQALLEAAASCAPSSAAARSGSALLSYATGLVCAGAPGTARLAASQGALAAALAATLSRAASAADAGHARALASLLRAQAASLAGADAADHVAAAHAHLGAFGDAARVAVLAISGLGMRRWPALTDAAAPADGAAASAEATVAALRALLSVGRAANELPAAAVQALRCGLVSSVQVRGGIPLFSPCVARLLALTPCPCPSRPAERRGPGSADARLHPAAGHRSEAGGDRGACVPRGCQ